MKSASNHIQTKPIDEALTPILSAPLDGPKERWTDAFCPCAVIPSYNHTDKLGAILEALGRHQLTCIVVNDGSDAPSRLQLQELAQQYPFVTLLHHAHNQGKGGAVKTGLRHARQSGFTHALQIDADGQHDTKDVRAMLDKAQQHTEALVLGRPIFDASIPKGRLYPRYITHVWVWIETLSLEIQDAMCGFRVYPLASTVALLDRVATGDRMDFDIEIAVRMFWSNVPFVTHETPVIYHPEGSSHFRLFHDNVLISWLHTRLFLGMCWRAPWLLLRKRKRSQAPTATLPTLSPAPKNHKQGLTRPAPTQASQGHWARTRERGSLWGIKFVMGLYRVMGRSVAMLFLWPLLGYFFITGRRAREASMLYLSRLYAHPGGAEALSHPPNRRTSFRHFLEFGRAALDKLSAWIGDIRRQQISWPNRELLLDQIESGQGAVLIGAHLGNIEILRAIAEDNPRLKMNVLVFTKHAAQFNAVVEALNPDSQVSLIPVDEISIDTGIQLKACIDRGEMVAILADRISAGTERRAQVVPFLGHPAPLPEGPFILASLLQCPVYLLFCLRKEGQTHYNIVLETFAESIDLPRHRRQEALRETIARYAQRLEAMCLQAPLQWFNFYDFWQPTTTEDTTSTPTPNDHSAHESH